MGGMGRFNGRSIVVLGQEKGDGGTQGSVVNHVGFIVDNVQQRVAQWKAAGVAVLPGNNGRSYVLRRILRRAIRFAYLLGADKLVMPSLADTAISVMGEAYPDLVKNREIGRAHV